MKALLFFILCFPAIKALKSCVNKMPRVGIIGGGIGGTSCAFFLKSLFGNSEVAIDVFDAEKIGGRLSVVDFSHKSYEEGASIIHSRNRYMTQFLKQFKLEKRKTPNGYFALYNGRKFVFSESEWQLENLWNIIYRYGFGFWKLRNYIDDMLNKFEKIYDLQDTGVSFDTVGSLLAAMDPKFVDFLHMTTKFGFESQGISEIVVDEIVMATIRANYGQNLNIQKMVGSVSVAGAVGNLWSVHGGNVKIPENLLKASEANFINLTVTTIKRLPTGEIQVITKPGSDIVEPGTEKATRVYDVVILATPQTSDSKFRIDFQGFNEEIKFLGRYHKTVCTLVDGNLAERYFPHKNPVTDEILTTADGILFNSIGRITPVDYTPEKYNKSTVWKIFTQDRMEDTDVHSLFSDVKDIYVREWLAYPHYGSSLRNDSFVLGPNLYHINAIEWAASAMEMSAIGARNVALLAFKNLMGKNRNEIDIPNTLSEAKNPANILKNAVRRLRSPGGKFYNPFYHGYGSRDPIVLKAHPAWGALCKADISVINESSLVGGLLASRTFNSH